MAYYKSSNEGAGTIVLLLIGLFIMIISMSSFYGAEKFFCQKYITNEFIKHNSVETSVDNIDSSKEGKLVRFAGMTVTKEVITDNIFNVSVDNSLSLNRVVEMYQYTEKRHSHRERRGKNSYRTYYTYTYDKGWHKYLINSSLFHYNNTYKNPKTMEYKNENFAAKNITIGAHNIPVSRLRTLPSSVKVEIDYGKIKVPIVSAIIENDYIYFNVDKEKLAKEDKEKAKLGLLTDERGKRIDFKIEKYQVKIDKPVIGDVRIHFSKHPNCEATILGKQAQDTVVPYKSEFSDILEVREGNRSIEQILSEGEKTSGTISWIARIFFFLFISFGCFLIFARLQYLGCFLALSNSFVLVNGILFVVWRSYQPLLGYFSLGLMLLGCFCSLIIWTNREGA